MPTVVQGFRCRADRWRRPASHAFGYRWSSGEACLRQRRPTFGVAIFGIGRADSGFTLIEVLIAVLVLGVGLLGMAALQATGMKVGQSSQMRTIATMAAYDLSERLRADPNNERIGALPVWSIGQSGCSATNATNVFERWRQDFCRLGLPAPQSGAAGASTDRAQVDCGSEQVCGDGNCEIVIRWDDSRGEPTGSEAANSEFRFCTRFPAAS